MPRIVKRGTRYRRVTDGKVFTYSKKRKQKKNIIYKNMSSLGSGFPKMIMIKHKYADQAAISMPAGGPALSTIYSCNSLYDPDVSGGGHQPYYFDQLSALYDHYVVIGSKIRCTFMPQSQTTPAFYVNMYIDDNAVTTSGNPIVNEEKQTGGGKAMCVLPGGNNKVTITRSWSAKKYFGKGVLANTELQGTGTTSPTEQSYYVINAICANGGDTALTNVLVEIEYLAIWKEIRDIAQS